MVNLPSVYQTTGLTFTKLLNQSHTLLLEFSSYNRLETFIQLLFLTIVKTHA